ncbi:MAG: hypothetical protein OIF57_12390 [Marinobacterium sp.]|nr:hypothetical protein [Marinobacterium sp.]
MNTQVLSTLPVASIASARTNQIQTKPMPVDTSLVEPALVDPLPAGPIPTEPMPVLPVEPTSNPAADAIWKQLDAIFGTAKELTADEQKQVDAIDEKLQALYEKEIDFDNEAQLKAWNAEIEGLHKELNSLYGVRTYEDLSEAEQKQVDDLYGQLDNILNPNAAQEKALYAQLDEIFGTPKTLTEAEQQQAEALHEQINSIYEAAAQKAQQAQQENGIDDDVISFMGFQLSAEDQKKVDTLSTQLDELYGVRSYDSLTEAEQKQVDNIYAQLDNLHIPTEPMIEPVMDQETTDLYAQLDKIFGIAKTLTEAEQKQVDALDEQISALFDENGELKAGQEETLTSLYNQIDTLFGVRSYDNLSSEEQKKVDEIFARLAEKQNELYNAEELADSAFSNDSLLDDAPFTNDGRDMTEADGENDWNNDSWQMIDWSTDGQDSYPGTDFNLQVEPVEAGEDLSMTGQIEFTPEMSFWF